MNNDELTYIEAGCHCELNSFAIAIPSTDLPVPVDFCHCNTCRHTSGELAVQYMPIHGVPLKSSRPVSRTRIVKQLGSTSSRSRSRSPNGRSVMAASHIHDQTINQTIGNMLAPPIVIHIEEPPPSPFVVSDLQQYQPTSANLTNYFCKTCSAQLFQLRKTVDDDDDETAESWFVAVGVLESTEGIVNIRSHVWVGDTLDGGFSNHLQMINNVELPRYKQGYGSELFSSSPGPVHESPAQLSAYCHCRSINLNITRPNDESESPFAPFPDLLYPYNVTRLSTIRNPSDQKWWLRADSNDNNFTRYLAGYCMCPSCRLTSGMELQTWAFVPISNILDPRTDEPISLGETERRLPGLKQYMSSPGKYRECCGICGAVVFWWQSDRPELIDVSVGLINEKDANGARAENWLEWHKHRVSFSEKSQSPALVNGLLQGLKADNIQSQ